MHENKSNDILHKIFIKNVIYMKEGVPAPRGVANTLFQDIFIVNTDINIAKDISPSYVVYIKVNIVSSWK